MGLDVVLMDFPAITDRGVNYAGTMQNKHGQSMDSSHLFNVPGFPLLSTSFSIIFLT